MYKLYRRARFPCDRPQSTHNRNLYNRTTTTSVRGSTCTKRTSLPFDRPVPSRDRISYNNKTSEIGATATKLNKKQFSNVRPILEPRQYRRSTVTSTLDVTSTILYKRSRYPFDRPFSTHNRNLYNRNTTTTSAITGRYPSYPAWSRQVWRRYDTEPTSTKARQVE